MWCTISCVILFECQKIIEVRFAMLLAIIRRLRYGYAFRKIPLSKQKFAIVDSEDYDRVMEFRWHAILFTPFTRLPTAGRRGERTHICIILWSMFRRGACATI